MTPSAGSRQPTTSNKTELAGPPEPEPVAARPGFLCAAIVREASVLSGDEAVGTFIAAWNTDDDSERLQLLTSCCTAGAEFISPKGVINGIDAMSAAMGEFRRASPSALVVNGAIDVHNRSVRFRWQTNWNDGREPLKGDDFGRLDKEGRITSMVSFYGSAAEPQ